LSLLDQELDEVSSASSNIGVWGAALLTGAGLVISSADIIGFEFGSFLYKAPERKRNGYFHEGRGVADMTTKISPNLAHSLCPKHNTQIEAVMLLGKVLSGATSRKG
jgi:hypothetical protein